MNGNVISYTYDTSSSANVAYLKKIQYGQGTAANRSVEFILNNPTSAPRPDKPVSAKAGFRQQTDRRVTSIEVRAASNALVTRYDLTYSQDPDSLRSQLAAVQRKGSDGQASLPPYSFEYSFRAAGRGLFGNTEASFAPSSTSCWPDGGIWAGIGPSTVFGTIADMNRDGVGDLYQVTNAYSTSAGIVAVSLGTGTSFRPGAGKTCGSSSFGQGTQWSPYKLLFSDQYADGAVMDFDGDGYPDHLLSNGLTGLYNGVPRLLRRGSAGGFTEPPLHTSFELAHDWGFNNLGWTYTFDWNPYIRITKTTNGEVDVTIALADVTGDGRPDLVATQLEGPYEYYDGVADDPTWPSWTGWGVFVNRGLLTGSGGTWLDFGTRPLRWPAAANAAIQHDYQGMISTVVLADQNGDGLADRIFSNAVEYGYGAGFYAQESVPSGVGLLVTNTTCTVTGTYDLNGDGFLDHIDAQDTSSSNPSWSVRFGTGHGFSSQAKVFPSDGGGIAPGCVEGNGVNTVPASLRDVNGDGVPDRLRYQVGVRLNAGALDPSAETDPNLPTAVLPGLLLRATDPLGGVVEFTYLAAAQMKDASGSSASPGFSLAKPVVSRIRHRDGRAGTPAVVTKLWYGGGVFDYAEKEFRGFGTVITTQVEDGVDASQITSTYLTDRDCAFALASSETSLGANVLARETLSYQTVTGGGAVPDEWTKCLPATRVVESVEGNEAAKKASRSSGFKCVEVLGRGERVLSPTEIHREGDVGQQAVSRRLPAG
ncbi:MAG: hypothetical protein FJ108_08115, partial [Deltaproteobacteria bacterium]|nr:hypothetical protein [Deltaproteobacteria bacterium]